MDREIIVTGYRSALLTAVIENGRAAELWTEPPEGDIRVGDIRIGKIKNIVQNIQAAFVEIAPGVTGYYSLNENKSHYFVNPKKNSIPKAQDEILVQVEKENLKTKSWKLTSQITYAGRYIVMKARPETADGSGSEPDKNSHSVMISSKITDENECMRLKNIVRDIVAQYPSGSDWIIRTQSSGTDEEDIRREISELMVYHNKIMSTYTKRVCYSKLRSGDTLYGEVIRRCSARGRCRIITDIPSVYDEIGQFLSSVSYAGDSCDLSFYDDPDYPLIKLKDLEAQIDKAVQKRVWLKSGAYLIIEPTEAMTVIDVNTGKSVSDRKDTEDHFFSINMEAAAEVCRQMRLRNMSGIIVVDFINMKDPEHVKELTEYLKAEAYKDSLRPVVVDRTALQLVEITRKKVHRPLSEQLRSLN